MAEQTDVVILGGGLAGLTLALQLRQRLPSLDVTVLERRRHPVPAAAHKVGESTVEIAAHYFSQVLGLREHLERCQIRKFGFRFFFSDGRRDVDRVLEIGFGRQLPTTTYQVDRGLFENFLAERAQAAGARFIDGAVVREVELGETETSGPGRGDAKAGGEARASGAAHEITYEHAGVEYRIAARWVVDASGRAGLLKRRLGLAEANGHDINAVWFRIGERIDMDTWSADEAWLGRCEPRERWRSTNHLVGDGYWVWLIPLASGSHSIGIVADARRHPLGTMNTFERAMGWLHRHQPRLAEEIETRRGALQDFVPLRGLSYGCKQVFSGARWALTGEAGVFLDPFYSPGGDFIAIGNTYITELIARDRAGEAVGRYAKIYEQLYLDFYRNTLPLYLDQYSLFGDPEVLPAKVMWDYTFYWGVLCQLFYQRRLTDLPMLGRIHSELAAVLALNEAMQPFLREWSRASRKRGAAEMIDQSAMDWFVELNRGLADELDDAAFAARMRAYRMLMQDLAERIVSRALADYPALDAGRIRALVGRGEGEGAGEARAPLRVELLEAVESVESVESAR
jgi:flavin-dependent dehydrogenase